ncbi:MAG: sugar phosphate isomerase/epimerase family protein [Bryobacteraceae bacterium]
MPAPRTTMGIATTSYLTARRPRDTYEFLEYCISLGSGGIQASLSSTDTAYIRKLRERAEQAGMYIEVMAGLPRADSAAFETMVRAAKDVGALCMRTACLSGRRYETFATLVDWQKFVSDSLAAIGRALPILEKHRMPMAVENHKDWTVEEQVSLIKDRSSEYFGACLDTGNNIALVDDPMEVVERLAPYAFSTHIKDMGVEPYPDGFLLSEAPLGEGFLDLKRIVKTILAARPKVKMTLEMITRDPLPIPCVTEKYWETFPDRGGRYLARALMMVNAKKRKQPLPRIAGLDQAAQLRLEDDNVKQCLHYAREQLGLA